MLKGFPEHQTDMVRARKMVGPALDQVLRGSNRKRHGQSLHAERKTVAWIHRSELPPRQSQNLSLLASEHWLHVLSLVHNSHFESFCSPELVGQKTTSADHHLLSPV